jgi:tetrahydromethanopterin S-methyltransferase subunit G
MKAFTRFLQKVDSIAPNPWYVDGMKQARPISQLGLLIGIVVGLILCYFLF